MKKDTTEIVLRPIGTIRTPFASASGTPIQSRYAHGAEGTVELLRSLSRGSETSEASIASG